MPAVGSPRLSAPVLGAARRWIIVAFPPNRSVRTQRDVGKNRVMPDGRHGIGIGLGTRTRSNAEKTRFRVDRPEPAIGPHPKPRDIIANGMNFPALHARRRHQHREIGFAAGAWKRAPDVVNLAFRSDPTRSHAISSPMV